MFQNSSRFREFIRFGLLLAKVSFFASGWGSGKYGSRLEIGVIAGDLLDNCSHRLYGVLLGPERLEAAGGLMLGGRKAPIELVAEKITLSRKGRAGQRSTLIRIRCRLSMKSIG